MPKTGRPPKFGKRGKLVGITIPEEDYLYCQEHKIDLSEFVHNALLLFRAPVKLEISQTTGAPELQEDPKRVAALAITQEDTKYLEVSKYFKEFLEEYIERIYPTILPKCPYNKQDKGQDNEYSIFYEKKGIKVTHKYLRDHWKELIRSSGWIYTPKPINPAPPKPATSGPRRPAEFNNTNRPDPYIQKRNKFLEQLRSSGQTDK